MFEKKQVPLSQAPGKQKLLVAIPGAMAFSVAAYLGIFKDITRFLSLALWAYAIVGLLEVIFGESLASAARRWDSLAGWKKFLLSLLVIVVAIVGFGALIPVFA